LADGDGRDEGGSSDSSLWRGEIRECGVLLDLGETDGRCDGGGDGSGGTVTVGSTDGLGLGETRREAVAVGEGAVVVLLRRFQLSAELFARAASRLATVSTSPPLKLPSVLFAGNVAVGG